MHLPSSDPIDATNLVEPAATEGWQASASGRPSYNVRERIMNGFHGGHHHGHTNDGGDTTAPTSPGAPTPPTPVAAFADLGATMNDATRALEGGLWQNVVEEGGQGLGSAGHYTTDLTTIQQGLQAEVKAGQFSGDTLAHVQTMLTDIGTALSAATASVNGGGDFGSVAAAETALRTSHLDILNIVNNDPTLTALATQNGATGFLAAPTAFADGVTAATAPHANLADIGVTFNDAASHILGGVNADNVGQLTSDVTTMVSDMQGLMASNPALFGGLTGVHAETVVRQLQLEESYLGQAGVNPDAGRASNDNLLDIIDIVQGDTNLANMASQGGVHGFTPFGDALAPTPAYVDNDAQTAFWGNFIAQSNALGQQAIAAVGAHDTGAIATLTGDLQAFQKTVTDFDASQGGIFEARFDNELLGNTSTLGAEVSKMLEGLQTGNAALVSAAAEEMHANAGDVGGNNTPVNGGTYNTDGLTSADVLSTAGTAATATTAAAPQTATAPTVAATAPATTATAPATVAASFSHDDGATAMDAHHSQLMEMAHHAQHVWG
jgi:hypothetical protein